MNKLNRSTLFFIVITAIFFIGARMYVYDLCAFEEIKNTFMARNKASLSAEKISAANAEKVNYNLTDATTTLVVGPD